MCLPDPALLDAHLVAILLAMAAVALALGIAANVLAARLLLGLDKTANDPVYRRSHRIAPRRDPSARVRLSLVS